MKAEIKKEPYIFQPYTIEIKIENIFQEKAITHISRMNKTIPDLMPDKETKNIVKMFLDELRTGLNKRP